MMSVFTRVPVCSPLQRRLGACSRLDWTRLWTRYSSTSADKTKQKIRQWQRIWTVPNAISMSRIALTPLIGYAVIIDRPILAAGLAITCGISDALDGWIARKWKQQSALGSLLDPIGDKILIGVLAGTLLWKNLLPGWLVLLVLARDAALIVSGIWMRWKMLPSPRKFKSFVDPSIATATITPTLVSKLNTALQLATVSLALIGGLICPKDLLHLLTPILHWTVASTTVWSAIQYIKDYRTVVRIIKK